MEKITNTEIKKVALVGLGLLAFGVAWALIMKEMLKAGDITAEQFNYYLMRPIEFAAAYERGDFKKKEVIEEVFVEHEEVNYHALPEKTA